MDRDVNGSGVRSDNSFVNNLVGTFSLTVCDAMTESMTQVAGHSGALAAAVSYLFQEPDCGIEDLRAPLGLSQPATVRLVNQMVDDDLASRTVHSSDGRRVRVNLTRKGKALATRILKARETGIGSLISLLTPEEQDALGALLGKALSMPARNRSEGERVCRLCDVESCPSERCPVEASVSDAKE